MVRTAVARTGRTGANGAPGAGEGLFIARVLGVPLFVDWSVLIIFSLILFNLGFGLFPSWHPDWSLLVTWGTALGAALLFFASILSHELSHAVVARTHGIPVSRITLFLFGGVTHMEREPPSPASEFWVAIVGPMTSVLIGAVAIAGGSWLAGPGVLGSVLDDPEAAMRSLSPLASLFLWLGHINVLVGLFNLVPGFPLDGGRVFRSIAWWITGDLRKGTRWASGAGRLVAWSLMALGAVNLLGGAALQGFWLLLIGWFLNNAARASYRELVIRETLHDVPIARVMRTRFSVLRPDTTLESLVHEELMASDQRAFPVVESDGRFAGLVCLEDVRKIPPARWGETLVSEVMTPVGELTTLPPEASADQAFSALGKKGVDQIPVLDQDRPVGLVRSQDLVKWLSLHGDAGDGRALQMP